MALIPWLQISGAVAGGVIGGFSGFIANTIHDRQVRRQTKQNISGALIGEIAALTHEIEKNYLTLLRSELLDADGQAEPANHFLRGERDYMPVYRSLGIHIGYLTAPLPQDLVSWYTSLAVGLERAHTIHELATRGDAKSLVSAIRLAQDQHVKFTELVGMSKMLLDRLAKL